MKIAIEAQRIFRANKHGMDFVALETIRELQKLDTTNKYFILVSPGPDHCLQETPNIHIIEINCPTYPLWEQIALPRVLKKIKPDILLCTSNTAPLYCSVPLILTLHDIIFLEPRKDSNKSLYQNMGRYYRRLIVPHILSHCKKIITVSNYERNHILETLKLPQEQIAAVYNGYNKHFRMIDRKEIPSIVKKYTNVENYIFFLGNTDPKKNVPRTLKAYSLYLQYSNQKRPLLIADLKEDVLDEILKKLQIEHIKLHIHCTGYVPNSDLPYLYNGAYIFLYTSLRESFGIPILEAMACGTPVITSNTSSMPEIAGEQAILVNPYKEENIMEKLLLLESDTHLYQQQVIYGLQRIKTFSWENTAKKLLSIYSSLSKEQA